MPKTSYYKMIDVWFLFLLVLIVLTIIGHTVITVILGPESAENKVFGQRKRLFNRRGTHSAGTQNGSVFEDDDEDNEDEGRGGGEECARKFAREGGRGEKREEALGRRMRKQERGARKSE